MDEVLHHCLRELAFDGDLGCNVTRLKDFIIDFYSHHNSHLSQNADDEFCAFAWSLIVEQPTVLIGLVDSDISSEIWIAPQTSAKRKAKARGEDCVKSSPPKLALIREPKNTSLKMLQDIYGDRLRLAVEPRAIFAALTGSHIRSSKMSPMVYSALQIITRGRESGVTVIELGKQSGYDQKTCFYLVRQLTELGLIMKVRRGGVGTHFCIHKYFFEHSSSWKEIRDEETRAELFREYAQSNEMDDETEFESSASPSFSPIDARHLSSFPLISARVMKLLNASENYLHASNNMLVIIGFSNPTKTDRRFFQSRIREMIQQGYIEKVLVPSRRKNSLKLVKCFRLVKSVPTIPADSGLVISDFDEDGDDLPFGPRRGVKLDTSIHKQIFDLLENSKTAGMTLNVELSFSLCQFDKRTIELLLARADRYPPPPQLSDLRVACLMETNGRERRHRYFTVANYGKLVDQEDFDKTSAGYCGTKCNNLGDFLTITSDEFCEREKDVNFHFDAFKNKGGIKAIDIKRENRVRNNQSLLNGIVKRGRPYRAHEQISDSIQGRVDKGSRGSSPTAQLTDSVADESLVADKLVEILEGHTGSKINSHDRMCVSLCEVDFPVDEHAENSSGRPKSLNIVPDALPDIFHKECYSGLKADDKLADSCSMNSELDAIQNNSVYPQNLMLTTTTETLSRSHSQEPEGNGASLCDEPAKAMKTSKMTPIANNRINVSQLRRENELLRLVEMGGGMINIQTKDFYDSHVRLIENLSLNGEPASAPVGTKTDKRTVNATFSSLEQKGKVRQLKTSVTTPSGISRPACIIYLPQITQTQLNAYLADLTKLTQRTASPRTNPLVKIDKSVHYVTQPSSRETPPVPLSRKENDEADTNEQRFHKNNYSNQFLTYDDNTIRETLLSERTTMSQLYGYIIGKAGRSRAFHLGIIQAFQSGDNLLGIVSHEKRIIDISLFCHEIPLKLYCSLISPTSFDDELLELIRDDFSSMNMKVKDLPSKLRSTLQLGRSRARARFLDILEYLRSLNLVTPLKPSTSGTTSFVSCLERGEYPTCFDMAPLEGWTSRTPLTAPKYWYFHDSSPILLWVISETKPPLWKTVEITTHAEALSYWDDLHEACTNPHISFDVRNENHFLTSAASVARSLRRPASWKLDYFFTWHQTQYLKQFINTSTLSTPLQNADEEARDGQLQKLCWVTGAPKDALEQHFFSAREKLLKSLDKKKQKAEKTRKYSEETKLSLAKKSEELRLQQEKEWIALLSSFHPHSLAGSAAVRMERVHKQFIQCGTFRDVSRWKKEIEIALREVNLASSEKFKVQTRRPVNRISISNNISSEASVQTLINMQGPTTQHASLASKHCQQTNDDAFNRPKKIARRHRFHWNQEFDELARDASAIIRARSRKLARLDWAAFEQVFPSVPRNTVRQRLSSMREAPGNDAYLRRLEDTWYDVWLKNKGTPDLPDDDDQSASNFDLIKHIEFLRTHIDKNALRVGLKVHVAEPSTVIIPSEVEHLTTSFNILMAEKVCSDWDFMWNAFIEEGREKKLKKAVISRCPDKFPPPRLHGPDEVIFAEGILKMVMGTPPEQYDAEKASFLLKHNGGKVLEHATKNLLSCGVLSKSQRDPQKPKPGRQLKISDINQNAIGGNVARDTFQDALSLFEEIEVSEPSWLQWPLTATDGDCATIIELVSEDKVDFHIDTSSAKAARSALDWNSKKADDDQIETAIYVHYRFGSEMREYRIEEDSVLLSNHPQQLLDTPEPVNRNFLHGLNYESESACCRKTTVDGLVDCMACLHNSWLALQDSLNSNGVEDAFWILDSVRKAGAKGISISKLFQSRGLRSGLDVILGRMIKADIPQLHLVGYELQHLVHASFVAKWSVPVSSNQDLVRIFPRRWLDIGGFRIDDFWQAALRSVIGLIIFRPGISQAEIRWRLRSVYDRQEVYEILRFLNKQGYIRYRAGYISSWTSENIFASFDEDEESKVYWFIGDRHWYQV